MLISKDRFIHYVTMYKEAFEEQDRFHNALKPFFDFPVCNYMSSLIDSYESLLVEVSECQDEDGIFGWWIFESPKEDKTITVQHQPSGDIEVYDVSTADGLYNYLYDMYHSED